MHTYTFTDKQLSSLISSAVTVGTIRARKIPNKEFLNKKEAMEVFFEGGGINEKEFDDLVKAGELEPLYDSTQNRPRPKFRTEAVVLLRDKINMTLDQIVGKA